MDFTLNSQVIMAFPLNNAKILSIFSLVFMMIIGYTATYAQSGTENARISVNIISALVNPLEALSLNRMAVGSFQGSYIKSATGIESLTGRLDVLGSNSSIINAASIAITSTGSYNLNPAAHTTATALSAVQPSSAFSSSGFLLSGNQTLSSSGATSPLSDSSSANSSLNISVFYN